MKKISLYRTATSEQLSYLTKAVKEATSALMNLFNVPVTDRYNSDFLSGGAWIINDRGSSQVGLTIDVSGKIHTYINESAFYKDAIKAHPRYTDTNEYMKFSSIEDAIKHLKKTVDPHRIWTSTHTKPRAPGKLPFATIPFKVNMKTFIASIRMHEMIGTWSDGMYYFQVNGNGIVYCSNTIDHSNSIMLYRKIDRDDISISPVLAEKMKEMKDKDHVVIATYKGNFFINGINVSTTGMQETRYDSIRKTVGMLMNNPGKARANIASLKKAIGKQKMFTIDASSRNLRVNGIDVPGTSAKGEGTFTTSSGTMFKQALEYFGTYNDEIVMVLGVNMPILFGNPAGLLAMSPDVPDT